MIAHRLSTLDYCDTRIEVESGRLVRAVEQAAELRDRIALAPAYRFSS
jgi:ABC-type bacteriocin/lantibiotic exporter with double-glycine peptidase domain